MKKMNKSLLTGVALCGVFVSCDSFASSDGSPISKAPARPASLNPAEKLAQSAAAPRVAPPAPNHTRTWHSCP